MVRFFLLPGLDDHYPFVVRPFAGAAAHRRGSWEAPLGFAAVVIGLSLLLGAPALFRRGALPVPSADAVLLAMLACLWAWLRLPGRRALAVALAAAALFLLLFRSADALVPAFFDRPFVLRRDGAYALDLYGLLRDSVSPWLFYPSLAALSFLLCALVYGFYRAFRFLFRCFDAAAYRIAFAAAAGALALLAVSGVVPIPRASTLPRVAQELRGLAHWKAFLEGEQRRIAGRGQESAAPGKDAARPLSRLGGRNVLLFIVESYGRTLYSEPFHFDPIQADLRRCEASLEAAGYSMVSGYLRSPTFGGNSWLADSTLTTGLRIDNQDAYEMLLASRARPMADYFNEAGYRSVAVMPGTTSDWPAGEFFRFQKKYYYKDFDYRGPTFRWAPTADQFVLNDIHRREVSVATQPLFVQYVLISSHYPFNRIPRYFEDWSVIGDGSIYARDDAVVVVPGAAGAATGGSEGYVTAIRYDMTLITEYLTRFLPAQDKSLIVVLGDHQPYTGVTGTGKPWSVPVHVISRDPQVLAPFSRRGYTPGWVPRQPPPHPGMEGFLPAFLDDFGGDDGPRPVGGAGTTAR